MTVDVKKIQVPPYVSALDRVVAHADEGLELILSTETLEEALKKLGQVAAVYRADDVHSILKQGESALLAGALTRSLVEGALAEKWYASRLSDEAPRSATLAVERQNVVEAVATDNLSVPNLHRWNNPISDVRFATARGGPGLPNLQAGISKKAGTTLERILLLPAPMMDLLGMCSHVNHAAAWLTAGEDSSELGVSASPEFAAILAQSAGTATASIRGFNHQGPVLDLLAAATTTHDFDVLAPLGLPKLVEDMKPKLPPAEEHAWLENEPPSAMDGLLDDVRNEALTVRQLVNSSPNPFAGPNIEVNLTSALPYLAARDLLMLTVDATFTGFSPLAAPTGARMLLEQGSELAWRFSDPSDSELLKRYRTHMDDATDRKKALENRLRTRTSSNRAVERLLFPRGRGNFAVDTRRMPNSQQAMIPSPQEHLSDLSLGVAESYWRFAYTLLTQAAHATPLGLLHAVARRDSSTGMPTLSHEMTALSLDTACTGAALVMRSLAPLIANQAGQPSPKEWLIELFQAVRKVHQKAQLIHFLG